MKSNIDDIVKVIKYIDDNSISIIELLTHGIKLEEINHVFANYMLVFDDLEYCYDSDYYYEFLSSNIRLSELGLIFMKLYR